MVYSFFSKTISKLKQYLFDVICIHFYSREILQGAREKQINDKQIIIFYNEFMMLRYLFNDKLNINI